MEPAVERVMMETADPPIVSWTLVGLKDAAGPEGETEAVSETAPPKPPRLLIVIMELLEEPPSTLR